jgi:hypothetical protein
MDVQAQTIGSALPSEREEHFADTAPVSPRETPEQRTRGRARQRRVSELRRESLLNLALAAAQGFGTHIKRDTNTKTACGHDWSIGGHPGRRKGHAVPAPALQEGSTIDGLWGAIVPAKPASTRHGIERDRQRLKGGCCAGGVSSKSPLPGLNSRPSQ